MPIKVYFNLPCFSTVYSNAKRYNLYYANTNQSKCFISIQAEVGRSRQKKVRLGKKSMQKQIESRQKQAEKGQCRYKSRQNQMNKLLEVCNSGQYSQCYGMNLLLFDFQKINTFDEKIIICYFCFRKVDGFSQR